MKTGRPISTALVAVVFLVALRTPSLHCRKLRHLFTDIKVHLYTVHALRVHPTEDASARELLFFFLFYNLTVNPRCSTANYRKQSLLFRFIVAYFVVIH